MLVGETLKPSFINSPLMRRSPQRGFSRASRSISSRISVNSGGRPTRPMGRRHFHRTIARCHRSSVAGLTSRTCREERGR